LKFRTAKPSTISTHFQKSYPRFSLKKSTRGTNLSSGVDKPRYPRKNFIHAFGLKLLKHSVLRLKPRITFIAKRRLKLRLLGWNFKNRG
jgi:hypothetical protein